MSPSCLPEICTLDCGTMNFGEGDYVMTNTPAMLKAMAAQIKALGVRPEIEIFDTGHLVLAKWLVEQGLIDDPVLVQLCMGIPWGAPDDIATLMALVDNLPQGWIFSAFSIGRNQLPYAALAVLAGGNVRVGLEDNLWLGKGQLATNGELVERAAIVRTWARAWPDEVREAEARSGDGMRAFLCARRLRSVRGRSTSSLRCKTRGEGCGDR